MTGQQAAMSVGGVANLAALLGISRQAVNSWRKIPAERVLAVEKVTGLAREALRPDLYVRNFPTQKKRKRG